MRRPWVRPVLVFLFHDIGWKLLSLAIAVLLWVLVASEPEISTFVTVPVQFKNMPEGLEVSSDIVESVNLELRGPSGELRNFQDSRPYSVVLDMSRVVAGERTFSIDDGDFRLPRGIRVVRAFPSQLRFDFERRAAATVPVQVRFGSPHEGYDVAGFQVSPATLRIVGPESHVNRIKAVATDPIDLGPVVGSAQFHVSAFVDDAHVRFASPPKVTVDVQVKAQPEQARRRGR